MGVYSTHTNELLELKDSVIMRMTISKLNATDPSMVEEELIDDMTRLQSLYWFRALAIHKQGSYQIEFSIPSMSTEVQPVTYLVHSPAVGDSQNSQSSSKSSKSKKKKKQESTIGTDQTTEHQVAGEEAVVTSSQEEVQISSEESSDNQAGKNKRKSSSMGAKDAVQAKPVKKQRISNNKPKLFTEDTTILFRPVAPIIFAGKLFDIEFSPLLSGYIYDDYFHIPLVNTEKLPKLNILFDTETTVSKFLSQIKVPMNKGLSIQPENTKYLTKQLLYVFENVFETHLIRNDERKARYIRILCKKKGKRQNADVLPIIFLVRFIIALSHIQESLLIQLISSSHGDDVEEGAEVVAEESVQENKEENKEENEKGNVKHGDGQVLENEALLREVSEYAQVVVAAVEQHIRKSVVEIQG